MDSWRFSRLFGKRIHWAVTYSLSNRKRGDRFPPSLIFTITHRCAGNLGWK